MKKEAAIALLTMLVVGFAAAGCQKAYYAVWETMGKEKRHLLRDNVEKAGEEQEEAAKQFEDVLSRIKTVYGLDGGELEAYYMALKGDFEHCQGRADIVRDRIDTVEEIARDLFAEWEAELATISSARLRADSAASLADTRRRYGKLEKAMRKAEKSMDPVLRNLNDYVLYLKHNLNAKAIGALRGEVKSIESEVNSLVADMDRSIQETDRFIQSMQP